MARYVTDFLPSEIDETTVSDNCFSFAGETNIGEGLDIDNFSKQFDKFSDSRRASVERIINNNHENYV